MRKKDNMKKIISAVKSKAVSVKENVLLIGSGITAIGVMFVVASVFIDLLGLYIGLLIGFLVVTEIVGLVNDNKKVG